MTHEEFLNDMYCFYSMNPHMRAVSSNEVDCLYHQKCEDGSIKKCAIGRHILEDKYSLDLENQSVDDIYFLDEIAPSLKGLDKKFLREVQLLHDSYSLWNPSRKEARINKYNELVEAAKFLDSNESTR